jgi:hypothetical protein
MLLLCVWDSFDTTINLLTRKVTLLLFDFPGFGAVHAMFHSNSLSGDMGFLCPVGGDGNSSIGMNSSNRSIGTAWLTITADCLGESPEVECATPCCDCHHG